MSHPCAIDDVIFRSPVPARRSDAEWQEIVRHLTGGLAELLGVELDVLEFSVVDEVALSCSMESRGRIGGLLDLRLRAQLLIEPIDDASSVFALVFPYSLGHRLALEGDAASLVDCVYERADGNVGRWRLKGWGRDEYEEFAGFAPRLLTPT